jgi:hypothetical protein
MIGQVATNFLVSDLPPTQVERLSFIDARLFFLGEIGRRDLTIRYSVSAIQSSRDIAIYKSIAPDNLVYDYKVRGYLPTSDFHRLFDRPAEDVLWWLKIGLGNSLSEGDSFPVESIENFNSTDPIQLSKITRAIHKKTSIDVNYLSLSSGIKKRKIAPHALIYTGKKCYVRGYDFLNKRFSDFVINRMTDIVITSESLQLREAASEDHQWLSFIELILTPHPKLSHPRAVEADYRMDNGKIIIKCRSAVAGYVLRRWGVDCSSNGSLNPQEFQLLLLNHDSLANVESAILAPGYTIKVSPDYQ